jgi:tetratricopeptide (TPR) repeat protein
LDDPHPDSSDRLLQIGELLDRQRTTLARTLLKEALQADPENVDLLYESARADSLDDDNAGARRTIEHIISIEPTHLAARWMLVNLLVDDDDLVEAERVALELLREYPRSADLYATYARVMLRALKLQKARDLCGEALRLSPDNESALRMMALCNLIERPNDPQNPSLRKLLAQRPDDQHTLALVVTALAHAGQTREALRGAKELLRLQPNSKHLVDNVRELTYGNHWSMVPLRPLQRYGWGASIGIWIGGILVVQMLGRSKPELANALSWFIFGYAVYSWVWPPVLRRLLLRD